VIEDYVHVELARLSLAIVKTLYCFAVGLACCYALLKLTVGV
jgi:succinate dehydrogenase hydrophobic anchor subunit